MADQGQRRGGIGLAKRGDEIGEVIFELSDIGDVAAGSRTAMAANIQRVAFYPALRQGPGESVDVVSAGPRRAVNDDRNAAGRRNACWLMPDTQRGAVTRAVPLDRGQGAHIDGTACRRD